MLRHAAIQDADSLARILREAQRGMMLGFPELHTPDEDRRFLRERVLPHDEVWVAEIEGRVAGFASLGRRAGDDYDYLQHLYVAPALQGRGIGGALWNKAKERRPAGFRWWTFQGNHRARRFYESRGARIVLRTDGESNDEKLPDVLYEWRPPDTERGGDRPR